MHSYEAVYDVTVIERPEMNNNRENEQSGTVEKICQSPGYFVCKILIRHIEQARFYKREYHNSK